MKRRHSVARRLIAAIGIVLVAGLAVMVAWSMAASRTMARDQAERFAASINEMTMAGLTAMMVTGTVGQRDVFLDQIRKLTAVSGLEVLRGEAVTAIFGKGGWKRSPMRWKRRYSLQVSPTWRSKKGKGPLDGLTTL